MHQMEKHCILNILLDGFLGDVVGALLLEVYLVQVDAGFVFRIVSAEIPVRLPVGVQAVGDEQRLRAAPCVL